MYWIMDFFQSTVGILTTVILGAASYYIWRRYFRVDPYWKSQGVTVARSSLFGFFKMIYKGPINVQKEMLTKYGKTFVSSFGGMQLYNCLEPDVIRDVFIKDFNVFNHRGFNFNNEPVLSEMLSSIEDIDKWKRVRSVMSPTFSTGKLRRMRVLVEDCTNIMVKNVDKLKNEKNQVDVKRVFGTFAMEVVTQVAFGTKVDSLIDENHPLIVNAGKFFQIFSKNPIKIVRVLIVFAFPKLAKWLNITFIEQDVIQFFRSLTIKLIEERRKNNDPKRKRCDFLQLMIDAVDNKLEQDEEPDDEDKLRYYSQDGKEYHKITTHNKTLTDEEILAQAVLFFFGGYETTAATVSYATHFLAVNKDEQDKLYEEVKATFDKEKEVTYDVIMSLKYLDAVISETLRLYPANIGIVRYATQDVTLNNGVRLPKGSLFQVPLIALHRDPDNFTDPDSFKPERFFPENQCHHPFAFLPFGAGPRNCIGMRLALMDVKLALFHFVLNFRFELADKTQIYPKNKPGGILTPKEVILCVEKRNN